MTLRTQWNTGRLYQRDGQRIGAELVIDDKGPRILFRDYSRMIDGVIALDPAVPFPASADSLRHRTMTAYDSSRGYRASSEAGRLRWQD